MEDLISLKRKLIVWKKTTEDPGSKLSNQPEEVVKEDVTKMIRTDSTIGVPTSTVDSVISTRGKLW